MPLGLPVEPEVYIKSAGSFALPKLALKLLSNKYASVNEISFCPNSGSLKITYFKYGKLVALVCLNLFQALLLVIKTSTLQSLRACFKVSGPYN